MQKLSGMFCCLYFNEINMGHSCSNLNHMLKFISSLGQPKIRFTRLMTNMCLAIRGDSGLKPNKMEGKR